MVEVNLRSLFRLDVPKPIAWCFVAHDGDRVPRYFLRSDTAWRVWHWPSRKLRAYWWRIFEHGEEPCRP